MIEVRGLVHRLSWSGLRPDELLLDNIDLTLAPGETVLLHGRNGSGKTTLAQYMAGLLIPAEGSVSVDGLQTHKIEQLREVRRRVGLLFQDSQEQIVAQTLLEDVAFGLENLAYPPEEIYRKSWAALVKVGLHEKAHRTLATLTPAERQRLALAGLLAMEPKYFILDEPDTAADRRGLELLIALMRELTAAGRGILIISHKEFWCERVDRVLLLEQGKITTGRIAPQAIRTPKTHKRETAKEFVLEAEDVRFAPDTNSKPTIEHFSARVRAGELIVLTGPTDSGKSTLVELLAGLVEPSAGRVLWNGKPLHALPAATRVRCVGPVFQEARHQLLGESVRAEIELGLKVQDVKGEESQQRARWACEAVGLDWQRYKDQPSNLLSGGEQARLALAAMIALDPQMLILDETTSALDPHGQAQLISLLNDLHQAGTTILLVTSDELPPLGHRLWKLEEGRLVYDGPLLQC